MDIRVMVAIHSLKYFSILYFGQFNSMDAGWTVAFKAVAGGSTDVYSLYSNGATMNADNPPAAQLDLTVDDHYKSEDINNWGNLDISLVRLSIHKGGTERGYFLFDDTGTNKESWMSRDRLLSANYVDLMDRTTPNNYFSVKGFSWAGYIRNFYIHGKHGGCAVDVGWLAIREKSAYSSCPWEISLKKPTIIFSPYNASAIYITEVYDDLFADFMAIQIYREVTSQMQSTTARIDSTTVSQDVATIQEGATTLSSDTTLTATSDVTRTVTGEINSTSDLELCLCPCRNSTTIFDIFLNEVINDLKIKKSETGAYVRSKTSATDTRAQMTGYAGILILSFVGCLILVPDVLSLVQTLCASKK